MFSLSSSICSTACSKTPPPATIHHPKLPIINLSISRNGVQQQQQHPRTTLTACAASQSTGFSLNSIFKKKCETCGGQGAIECPGCKGSGKNKKNGNIFERWKCYDCQGFGMKGCPTCGKGGLTPEQRGER